jgi:hypothetical protein
VTSLLAACSSGPGPLGSGGTPGTQCVDFAAGNPVTMSLDDLHNTGTMPVTLRHFELPAASGLIVTKTWLVPVYHDPKTGNYVVVGVGFPYPPTTAPEWVNSRPAIGATIRPGQNLVFGVTRPTANAGRSGGPAIGYTAGGSSYFVTEKVSVVVAPSCN